MTKQLRMHRVGATRFFATIIDYASLPIGTISGTTDDSAKVNVKRGSTRNYPITQMSCCEAAVAGDCLHVLRRRSQTLPLFAAQTMGNANTRIGPIPVLRIAIVVGPCRGG